MGVRSVAVIAVEMDQLRERSLFVSALALIVYFEIDNYYLLGLESGYINSSSSLY
jgi:hypothetical protein